MNRSLDRFKNVFKRWMAVPLLVALILITMFGCSEGNKIELDPSNPVSIVIWHYYHGAQKSAFDQAVKEFNETVGYERGIIVEAVSYGGVDELASSVMAAANGELDAGGMPDIFGSYGDTALEILNMGMAAAIDSYMSAAEIEEYEESFIREGRIGTDNLYVFPIAKSTESIMLNKTDFDAFVAGLEASGSNETVSYDDLATWEGILKVADAYYRYTQDHSPDRKGKAFMGIDSVANYMIVGSKQLGQDIVKVEDGNATIQADREIMSKLWDTYYEAMVKGRFTKIGRFCSDDIKTGDSLCFIGSTASASYFPTELALGSEQKRDIEMLVLPMPIFEGSDKVSVSQGAGMVISKSVPEREYASVLFLEWFTQEERNVTFSLNSSYLPVKKEALDENLLDSVFQTINSEDVGAQNSIKALRVGIDQLRSYDFYSSEVFDGGVAFREKLQAGPTNAAREDRETYLGLIQQGRSEESAYLEVFNQSGDKFDQWLDSLDE